MTRDCVSRHSISVCDREFTIEFVDNWKKVSHDEENCPRHAGEVHWISSNIRIDESRKKSDVEITLWHEVVHAIAETLRIKGIDPNGEDFEAATDQIAVGIHSVLKSVGISFYDAVKSKDVASKKESIF